MSGAARPARVRPLALGREAVAIALSQPVMTAATAFVLAAVCAVILVTTGQSAAAEARVLASVDAAGTRTIVVSDDTGQGGIHVDSVPAIEALAAVSWALGLTPASDVRNADLGSAGTRVPSRTYYGELPSEVHATRTPGAGEAIAGAAALPSLGVEYPAVGLLTQTSSSVVVGSFTAVDPLSFLESDVLIRGPVEPAGSADLTTQGPRLSSIVVVVDDVQHVSAVASALRAVIVAESQRYDVETPAALLELRSVVASDLGAASRRQMLIVLGVGLLVVAIMLASGVSQRRRDFGRRRALGASRSTIVALVLGQSLVAALLGTVLGVIVGLIGVDRVAGSLPSGTFSLGVVVLTVLTAALASVPPALLAAYRDPVRILRVP